MQFKVLKDFVDKKGNLRKVDETINLVNIGKFTHGLIDHGFLESDQVAGFRRWEDGAITSKLTGLLIAPEDYVTASGKKHFTYEAALCIEGHRDDGWRLPTRSEWVLICEEFGQKDGKLNAKTLMENLKLGLNGADWYDGDGVCYAGAVGFYWSSTPYSSSSNAYYLRFDGTSNVFPSSNYNRQRGYSVRLVKEISK